MGERPFACDHVRRVVPSSRTTGIDIVHNRLPVLFAQSTRRVLLVALVAIAAPSPSQAAPGWAPARAGTYDAWAQGNAAFKRGRYQEAFDWFLSGYRTGDSSFLLSMAACRRAMGQPASAVGFLRA